MLEVLYTCDWASPAADTDSIGSLQDAEIDYELNAFDEDENTKQDGSEKDVEYMERMMTMLLHARGNSDTLTELIREMGQEMNVEERRKLARKTVDTIAKMS